MILDRFNIDGQVAIVTGKTLEVDGGIDVPNLDFGMPDL